MPDDNEEDHELYVVHHYSRDHTDVSEFLAAEFSWAGLDRTGQSGPDQIISYLINHIIML